MLEKNKNSEKELGATEPTTENEPFTQAEIDALLKAMSEKSDLIEASGKKLDETIQEPGVKEATKEATREVEKAETEAKEQMAQATGQPIVIEPTENIENEPQTFVVGDIVEYEGKVFEISQIIPREGIFYCTLETTPGRSGNNICTDIDINKITKASEEQIKQFKKEKEGSGENPESTEKKKLPEKYKDIAVGQKYLEISFPEQEGVNILNGNIEEIEISERGDNIIIYWRADNFSGGVKTKFDEIEKVDTGVWAKQEDLEEAKSKGFTLKKNHNTGEWELVKEKSGEASDLNEQEMAIINGIVAEYEPILANIEAKLNNSPTRDELNDLNKLTSGSYNTLCAKINTNVRKDEKNQTNNSEVKAIKSKLFKLLEEVREKITELKDGETERKVDENLKMGFEEGQEVVIRKDGVLEPGWEITSFKETKSLDGEIMARAEVKKGNEKWEISVATLNELNNRDWGEIGKQAGIAGAGMLASVAGVRGPADIIAYAHQKHEVGKISKTTEQLLEQNTRVRDLIKAKLKQEVGDKKSQTRILIDELNKELSHAKKGTQKHSEVRNKLAEVIKLNRESIKEKDKIDKNTDEVNKLEADLKDRKSKTGAELEKIQKLYLETKVSGMQAMREGINTALTATGAFALRAPMYGIMDGIGKWQSLKKEKQQASDEFGKSIKDVKKEAEKVTFRELFVNPVVDTFRKATFQDEKGKGPRTGTQKAVDFARAAGKIGRYVGMTATGLTGFGASFDNLLEGLSGKTNFTETAHNFTGNFERYGKIIKAGQEIYHNPSEVAKILLHEQPSTKTPLNAEALLHQQEQLTEKFPGIANEKGEILTTTSPHQPGATYVESTKQKSITFDIITDKENNYKKVEIPFTDPSKTATATVNEYLQQKGFDPEQVINAQIKTDVSSKSITATIFQETSTNDAAGASAYEGLDAGQRQEIQRSVGNIVQKYDLEHKDLIYEKNKMVIHANIGGKDTSFEIPVKEGDNDWNLLRNFLSGHSNISADDITSVKIEQGDSEFKPGDLPEHKQFNPPLSEELKNGKSPSEVVAPVKESFSTDAISPTGTETNQLIDGKSQKTGGDSLLQDQDNTQIIESKEATYLDDSIPKNTPQGAKPVLENIPEANSFAQATREATVMSKNINASIFSGKPEAKGLIADRIEQIDSIKKEGAFHDKKAVSELTEQVKKITYNELLPKEHKTQSTSELLGDIKKGKTDIDTALNAWINNPKNKINFEKIHDIATKIKPLDSNNEINKTIINADKLFEILRSKPKK